MIFYRYKCGNCGHRAIRTKESVELLCPVCTRILQYQGKIELSREQIFELVESRR